MLSLTSRTNARNQGAAGTAAQRPTAPSGGHRASHRVNTKGPLKAKSYKTAPRSPCPYQSITTLPEFPEIIAANP
ncbi:MAG TPA: hypothetical protein VJ886_01965, partial [Roseovarius sp.]|nr:hypothetical protein [Roseovarius sp.]